MFTVLRHQLQWRHNERDGVSNHRRPDCLLSLLFRRRTQKTSNLRVTRLCEGHPPVTAGFPSQRASDAKKVSFWWRHHTNVLVATLENMSKCVIWTNKKPLIWPQYKENKTKQWKYFAGHTVFKDIIQIYLHLQVSHLGWNSQWINYRAYKIDRPTWQMYWLADTSVCVALCSIIWEARTGPVLCNKITHWFTSRINTVSPALSDFRERWFSQGEALKVVKCI